MRDIMSKSPVPAEIHTAADKTDHDCLSENLCTTSALVWHFMDAVDTVRSDTLQTQYRRWLANVVSRSCVVLHHDGEEILDPPQLQLHVSQSGDASGFNEALLGFHKSMAESWNEQWAEMSEAQLLHKPCNNGNRTLQDIVLFCSMLERWRRTRRRSQLRPAAMTLLRRFRNILVSWVSMHFDKYVMEVYVASHNCNAPQPSLSRRNSGKRNHTSVSPEAIWELMAKARRTGISLRQAINSNDDNPIAGGSDSSAPRWRNKFQTMYNKNVALSFLPHEVNHVSMAADPSTHSSKEIMVSLVYSWENDLGACPNIQIVPPGKDVTWRDADLPDDIAFLAAAKKLDRVAAFRQMQSISHQLLHLTGGRVCLERFALPEEACLRSVANDEVRLLRVIDGKNVAVLKNTVSHQAIEVLPSAVVQAPLLCLGLDQGSVGGAGVSFGTNHLKMMLYAKYDKIHRLIRDDKLAIKHCCLGIFMKAQLFSAYLFGLNYEPFGKGGFSQLKRSLLNVFLATESIESPLWKKYCENIAIDFGMPCSTRDEQQAVFDAVALAPSFHDKLGLPKLGRWFSWNDSAREHMQEFHALKMLLEHHLGDRCVEPNETSAAPSL
jgi:hypothetical protein